MGPLTLEAALEVWEQGRGACTTRRALALLRAAGGEADEGALARLPLGERDRRLLELRGATFGPEMTAVSLCPHCGEEVEVRLPVAGLLEISEACIRLPQGQGPAGSVTLASGLAHFRLPTSEDLLAAQELAKEISAEQELVRRCLLAKGSSRDAAAETVLSGEELAALAQAMSEADPLAEILLDLRCGACGESWQELFEIAEFLYEEVSLLARRLLQEVSALARGYGWREAEILAMSPQRRHAYLELLAS